MKPYRFRKFLHMIACGICVGMLVMIKRWQDVLLASFIAIVLIYPILKLLESKKGYASFFVEKSPGEVRVSLVLLMGMLSCLTFIGWGVFDRKYIALCSLLMWGFGDACAALIGIPYGRHKIGKKSLEGSLAMFFIVSFLLCLLVMKIHTLFPFSKILVISFVSALVCALSELFTPSKFDTFTVPLFTLMALLLMERIV